jgi:hypothetical protein
MARPLQEFDRGLGFLKDERDFLYYFIRTIIFVPKCAPHWTVQKYTPEFMRDPSIGIWNNR